MHRLRKPEPQRVEPPERPRATAAEPLTIGELARRSGIAASALRFYEARGLIAGARTSGGHRVYPRHVLRRLGFIRAAQSVGLGLDEVAAALALLPAGRTPTKADWERASRGWLPRLDAQIAALQRLRAKLGSCVGCGCLSLKACALYNRDDGAAALGSGARYLAGDAPVSGVTGAAVHAPASAAGPRVTPVPRAAPATTPRPGRSGA